MRRLLKKAAFFVHGEKRGRAKGMRCNYPDNWATHAALQSSVCLPQWPTINEFFRLLWEDIANLEFHCCLLHVITYHICIVDNSDKLRIFRKSQREQEEEQSEIEFPRGSIVVPWPVHFKPNWSRILPPRLLATQIEMNDVGVIYTLPGFVVATPSIAFSPWCPQLQRRLCQNFHLWFIRELSNFHVWGTHTWIFFERA